MKRGWVNDENFHFWVNYAFNDSEIRTISKMLLHFAFTSILWGPRKCQCILSLNTQKHQPWQSYHKCHLSVFPASMCETRWHRQIRQVWDVSAGTFHTCLCSGLLCDSMCSCRWGHIMVIMGTLLRAPAVIFTQMEHDHFRRIQYNKKCAWKCLRVFLGCF